MSLGHRRVTEFQIVALSVFSFGKLDCQNGKTVARKENLHVQCIVADISIYQTGGQFCAL